MFNYYLLLQVPSRSMKEFLATARNNLHISGDNQEKQKFSITLPERPANPPKVSGIGKDLKKFASVTWKIEERASIFVFFFIKENQVVVGNLMDFERSTAFAYNPFRDLWEFFNMILNAIKLPKNHNNNLKL